MFEAAVFFKGNINTKNQTRISTTIATKYGLTDNFLFAVSLILTTK
jgi:hypothetical protein